MAETIIAPVPSGVQSTFEKPLGPQPNVDKNRKGVWKKAFDQITHEDVKPKDETPVVEPVKEEPKQTEPPKESPKEAPASDKKPESPLEAVLAKPTKEPEKVEEPDVLKEFDEKTANWQRAREVMKTQSGELKTLREKVKSLETTPKVEPSVIEELTKERDEIRTRYQQQEERLKAINAEYSDEYQGMLAARENDLNKLATRMKSYADDIKANDLIAALSLPEGRVRSAQIKEAMAELDADDKLRITSLIDKIEGHDEKIADFKKDLPRKWDDIQARREAQLVEQSQASIKQLETEFGKVSETLPSNSVTLREVPDDVPGGTEWNQEIRAARDNALRVLKPNGADFNESVSIAMKGARYDSLEKRYLSLHSDYSELKQKYNEAVGAGPDFKGGGKPTRETPKKPAMKYHEALAAIKSGQVGEF